MAEGGPSPKLRFDHESWISNGYPIEVFRKAADHLATQMAKLDSSQLLYFYARFKQGNDGPCNSPKPSFYDFQGKQKWSAWKELGEMPKEDAMWQYIEKIQTLDPDWDPFSEYSSSSSQKSVGPVMSVMANSERTLEEHEKTAFDFIKDNNVEHVKNLIMSNNEKFDFNLKDSDGLALLHWASDRGHSDAVRWLITNGADINIADSDGQTPLHYASSCGHFEIVSILLKNGASFDIKDDDGLLAKDVALNESVSKLFA